MEEKKEKGIRLHVFLAKCGVASRRSSEKMILDGRVFVNGQVVLQLGTKVFDSDSVMLDGKIVTLEKKMRYVLLNKPVGVVSTLSDEMGRETAAHILSSSFSERLYNVGRLDMFSSGALLFTNDGDFAAKISHPRSEIEKEYIVEASSHLPRSLAKDFMKGMRIEGVFYRANFAEDVNSHEMRIVLTEGKNREIRRVFEFAGVKVRSLKRIRIGCVLLGTLKPGEFRELESMEVEKLLSLCKNKNDSETY